MLGAIGAGTLGLPFLGSLRSVARGDDPPLRLVLFFSGNGAHKQRYWKPAGSGSDYALGALPEMLSPLEGMQERMMMVADLEQIDKSGHAGMQTCLSGRRRRIDEIYASGITIDHHIAEGLGERAVALGARLVGESSPERHLSFLGSGRPATVLQDPRDAFDRFLGGVGTSSTAEPPSLTRGRILDAALGDVRRLQSRLPAVDRERLDVHLDAVSSLGARLGEMSAATCDPVAPSVGFDVRSNDNYPLVLKRQMDVAVQLLACNVTPVVTLQFGSSGSTNLQPHWSGEGLTMYRREDNGSPSNEHRIAHLEHGDQAKTDLENWYFRQFRYLLDRMDEVPEGTGTLLDHSLVVWVKHFGGNERNNHAADHMLYVLAGGVGGRLAMGRYVSFPGRSHQDLWVWLANLFGMPDTSFGDPDYCEGALPL
jgi:hypothetical protein